MKKYSWILFCLLSFTVWGSEPLMLLNPGRETFLNFPSAVLPDKTVTVFLPEPAVPLRKKYPVVYLIGAGPKEASSVQALLARSEKKAIFVGINITKEELQEPGKITTFFSRELVPYIDTNYPTLAEPSYRGIAVKGAQSMRVLAALLAKKQLFARAFVLNSGKEPVSFAGADVKLRLLAAGNREELAVLWQTLQETGRMYGTQVALHITPETSLPDLIDLDYLFAEQADLQLVKLEGQTDTKTVFLTPNAKITFVTWAVLANGMRFDYIPLSLRISPPYLAWDPFSGVLQPIAGAAAGKVKIGVVVDNLDFTAKIRLKK